MNKQAIKHQPTEDFTIRIPIKMIMSVDEKGNVLPIFFHWHDLDGIPIAVKIDRIISITQQHERKSGTVGDRFEVEINGKRELFYYTKIQPRKWFKIVPVSEDEYNEYYRKPGEAKGSWHQ